MGGMFEPIDESTSSLDKSQLRSDLTRLNNKINVAKLYLYIRAMHADA